MLRIYAAGGTGTNIGKGIKDLDVDICFIDTSDSNLRNVDRDHVFLVPDISGAGKDRSLTYEKFKDISEDVLIKFKPSDTLNIVVSSLSGGSGSIIGPLLVKELIASGKNTIVIGIDSRHSLIELNNSVKTLKTYKSISDATGKSVSLFYVENHDRKEADQRAMQFVNLLTLLVDKQNTDEFDVTDLRNFINFENVTDNRPSVSVLDVGQNEPITPEKNTSVVSTVFMTTDRNATIYPVTPEYLATCVVTDKSFTVGDVRIDNVLGKLSIIVDNLDQEIKQCTDNKKINKFKDLDVSGVKTGDVVL